MLRYFFKKNNNTPGLWPKLYKNTLNFAKIYAAHDDSDTRPSPGRIGDNGQSETRRDQGEIGRIITGLERVRTERFRLRLYIYVYFYFTF